MEIQANLRLLQDSRDSLLITFADRNQRFQSFLVDIDRDRGMVALDELIPNTGERFLQNGEAFRVEAFHEGVRIAWECERPVQFGEHDGVPCYWAALPAEVLYHQRRNAYRASIKQSQPIAAEIAGEKLRAPLSGQLLDISATGASCASPAMSPNACIPARSTKTSAPSCHRARSVARSNCVTCASTKSSTRPSPASASAR